MMIKAIAVALALLVAGCTTAPAPLRYPDGRVVDCGSAWLGVGNAAGMAAVAQAREAQCIADHRSQGAERL